MVIGAMTLFSWTCTDPALRCGKQGATERWSDSDCHPATETEPMKASIKSVVAVVALSLILAGCGGGGGSGSDRGGNGQAPPTTETPPTTGTPPADGTPPTNPGSDPVAQQTVRVVDGDTIEVDGRRYRLQGFDAPE